MNEEGKLKNSMRKPDAPSKTDAPASLSATNRIPDIRDIPRPSGNTDAQKPSGIPKKQNPARKPGVAKLSPEERKRRAARAKRKKQLEQQRKLALLCAAIILTILAGVGIKSCAGKNADRQANGTRVSENKKNRIKPEGTVTLSVTAVGDCTLATDSNMRESRSFESMMKKQKNDYSYFFKKVKPYFEDDDLTIVNFEGVLSDRGSRQPKRYAFRGDPEYIKILTSSSVESANIANNHTFDYGDDAFQDTKDIMNENDVTPFGLDEIAIMDIKGLRVGLIGTNALNDKSSEEYPEIFEKLKQEEPDLIIATFHWGEEKAKFPSKSQTKLAHEAIDNGADLVIGHHPHVLQGIEKYKGKYIVYSLGNFCFGGNHNPSDKDSMIFKQTFTFVDGVLQLDKDNVSVIPCSISSQKKVNDYQPTPLSGKQYTSVKEKIEERSERFEGIENVKFIKKSKES